MARGVAALVTALVLTVGVAAPATAHNGFVSSDPANGATVARTPDAVVLTFAEPAVSLGTQVRVTGPDGAVADGPPQLVDTTVRQPLVDGAPAGSYMVDWRVTSADGHPITGRLSFTSEAAGAGTYPGPAEAPAPAPVKKESTVWLWLALAGLLLAAAGTLALRRRRQRPSD